MKKIKFLFGMLAVIGLVSFLSSCEKTSVVTVSFDVDSAITAVPGQVVAITCTMTPAVDGEVGKLVISDGTNSVDSTYNSTSTVTYAYNYTVPSDATVGSDIVLSFEATDALSDLKTNEIITITVEAGTPNIYTASDVVSNYVSTTLDNSMIFDLGETSVEMQGGDFADGELAFVWQNTYGYSVVSPNAAWIATLYGYNGITYSTSDKQETKIMSYTGQWADLTQEAIDALTITTETVEGGGNGVQNLSEGDIVVFETADGRKGALKVKTNAKVSMNMTADLTYQVTPGTAGK